ncbi:MAG: RluA family pseudouridine synthase [Saccharofermentanales bacterium]|jgi:23S rRNA pseudouridine1911/1915/1917 synthase
MITIETPPILYEDNHLLIAVKAPGLLAQADRTGAPDMLGLLKRDLVRRYNKPGDAFLGLVHRLDRPVSGLMVFAKTSKAAGRLSKQFREQTVERYYVARVCGVPPTASGRLDDVLSPNMIHGQIRVTTDGVEASLLWQTVAVDRGREEALLFIQLITGRRHQIRVQLASAGWPILGDRRYGRQTARDQSVETVALHACGLVLTHPTRRERRAFYCGPDINPSFESEDADRLSQFMEEQQKKGRLPRA